MPPLAHAGHYIAGVLYLLPVVLIGGVLWIQGRREDRRADLDGDDERPDANLGR